MNKEAQRIAIRIAGIYVAIGVIWILLTDYYSLILSKDNIQSYITFQRYKGWFFTMVTGVLFYYLIEQRTHRLIQSKDELEKKEKQLQQSTLRYQSLFIHNPNGVIELDLMGNLVSLNPSGEDIFKISTEEAKGKRIDQFIDSKEMDRVRNYFYEVVNGQSIKFETLLINKEGNVRNIRCALIPIIVSEQVSGVYGIISDITEQKKNEEMMIMNEKMYVIGQLAAAVAHEIRNPLTSIKGFVQLMHETKSLNPAYLDIMMSEIDRLHTITSEMLLLGKKQEAQLAPIDLGVLLKQVTVLMEAQAHLNNADLSFKQPFKGDITVFGDSNQLKQLFINIIQNSIEAIKDNGKIDIVLDVQESTAVVTVTDNGQGMEEERIKRLGEPFYSTKEKGTGLGLAVCKKIIERHEGNIEFDSEVGKGTTVTVRLPIQKAAE
jgi:two-component system, sporulation sensor kinase E